MESDELKTLENIKELSARYLNVLKPTTKKTYNAEIKIASYSELGCVITNLLKLSILALESDNSKKSSIDIGLVLEQALNLFPSDEFELLDIFNELLIEK